MASMRAERRPHETPPFVGVDEMMSASALSAAPHWRCVAMANNGAPLLFLGAAMLMFGSINAYIGYNLLGERGIETKKKIMEATNRVRDITAAQIAEREPRAPKEAEK